MNVINATHRFEAARVLSGLGPAEVARRARMLARAHGAARYRDHIADLAVTALSLGASAEEALSRAREQAIRLSETGGDAA